MSLSLSRARNHVTYRMRNPNARLKIVHVVDSLEVGGLERVVCDLAQAQKALGHSVTVFSICRTEGLLPELVAAGIPVVVGGKSRSLDVAVLSKLREATVDADVVHAHNFVPNYYSAVALLGVRRSPVQVCTCHDMGTRLARRSLRWMFRLSLLRTARVAMVGQQVHDRFVGSQWVAQKSAVTVMNGVPVQRFASSPLRRAVARKALALSPESLVIGCVGRLVPLKNHQLMVGVMPALIARFPDLKLVIVGGGALAGELHDLVSKLGLTDSVILAGQRSDVGDLLPAFDIYALPSLTEGLSISLLEAAATGLSIVATSVGGNPEVVFHGRTGVLIPSADPAALMEALSRLAANPALRLELGHAALDWVRAHGSIDALCASYDGVYRHALRG